MAGHAAEFGAMSDEEALAKVDGIGVIARVSPERKVRLVDVPRKEPKDDRESAFSADTFSDKTFARTTAVSFVLLRRTATAVSPATAASAAARSVPSAPRCWSSRHCRSRRWPTTAADAHATT